MKTRTIRDAGIEIQSSINQQKDFQQNLQQQIEELKAKVEAKKAEEARIAALPKPSFPPAPVAQASVDTSDAKMFIYMKESGNNPNSVNKSSGACGLAQALPCSKMGCALGDYACQDAWATQYMQNRYGTWENAKAFWLQHSWW